MTSWPSLKVVIRRSILHNCIHASYNVVKDRVKVIFDNNSTTTHPADIVVKCRDIYRGITGRPLPVDVRLQIEIDFGAVSSFGGDDLLKYFRGENMSASAVPTKSIISLAETLVPRLRDWIGRHPGNAPTLYPVNDKEWRKVVNWINSVCAGMYTREDLTETVQALRKITG